MALLNNLSRVKTFCCPINNCLEAFTRQWKLERHVNSHKGERPYKCEHSGCSKAYQCQTHLNRHIRCSHKNNTILLPCPVQSCTSTFSKESSLEKHVKNHGEPRKFLCSVCGVSFQKQRKYLNHQKLHQSPLTCAVCESIWPTRHLLQRHMTSHRLRQCAYAGCSFSCQSRSLMRSHDHAFHRTVYSCEVCKKLFNNKGILRDHVLVHLPAHHRGMFSCPHQECKRRYFQERNLRHHIKSFHSLTRYYCPTRNCSSSYISMVKLKKHQERMHKTDQRKNKLIANLITIAPTFDDVADAASAESKEQFQLIITSS